MINQVIENEDGITKYVDDIKVSGTTFEETLERLEKVFNLIRLHGLKLNPTKTQFFRDSADHLGFIISDLGIGKQSEKIKKLDDFEKKHTKRGKFSIKTKNDILALIGHTGLYRDFIPEYSQIVNPIYNLTKGDVPVEWTEVQQNAFEKLKEEYRKDFKLRQAPKSGDLYLDTKLSESAMNGVLFYMENDEKRIILFVSIAFKEHQKNFTLFDRETMCLVKCVQKLQIWLHGRRVHIRSNLLPIINRFREIAQTHRKAAHWITVLNCYDLIYDMSLSNNALYKIKAPELEINNISTQTPVLPDEVICDPDIIYDSEERSLETDE
ncbi:unnamed protein product, partial [Allacma fusca]